MYFHYEGKRIFYKRQKGKGLPVLLLHGWGCSHNTLRPVFDFYVFLGREIIALDFPPFGKSDPPDENYTVHTYADIVQKLLAELGVKKVDVFAHSFGARIALIISECNLINTLVITGGAGLTPKFNLRKKCRIFVYKLRKKLGLREKKNAGSSDWQALDGRMKRVFTSVVNTHLDDYLSKVKCPTLLLWGKRDDQTPPYMAKKMAKGIGNSTLIFVENGGHFAFIDEPREFFAVLCEFYRGRDDA